MPDAVRPFVLVSATNLLLIEVLQAVHTFSDAECFVVAPKQLPFIGFPNLAKRCFEAGFDGNDDERVISEINRIAEQRPDLIVVPCDCPGARITDRIASRLNAAIIPSPDSSMLNCFDDKWRFYQFCKQHECSCQAISDTTIGFFAAMFRSKTEGDRLPNTECNRVQL